MLRHLGYRNVFGNERGSSLANRPQADLERLREEAAVRLARTVKTKRQQAAKNKLASFHSGAPQVAFIIDDFGNSLDTARPFLNASFPLAISVLPNLPYSQALAEEAGKAGKPLLLHLPLEAEKENKFLGPGALLTKMDNTTLKSLIEQDLNTVPGAQGINNHMGSKASANSRVAHEVALEAKLHHLFVIDSLTTPDSVLYDEAQKMGVPSARREIFLDDETKEAYIQGQMNDLIRIARLKGGAIAIGHPHPETLEVLQQMIPKMEKEGVRVVPITRFLTK